MKIIGVIIIVAALLIFTLTLVNEKLREHIKLILTAGMIFGGIGFGLMFYERLVEVTLPGGTSFKTVVQKTVDDANLINEIKDTVVTQSHTIGLIAQRAEDLDRELNQKLSLSEERLKLLNDEQKKASEVLALIRSDQDFISLVYRAQSYDANAFYGLKKLASVGTKFSDQANRVVKDVENRLSNENLWLLQFMPNEDKGSYQYSGPFTTEEIQEAIDFQSLEIMLDYIRNRKLVVFMNYMVETTLPENDLYRKTRIMRAISEIVGEKFYPWKIEQFQDWWNAKREHYQSWPKQTYYDAKSLFESGNSQNALMLFRKVVDSDTQSDKSRALAIACAIELGKIELANHLLTSFLNTNSRWELWAKVKISLETEGTLRATEMLADLSTRFPSFPERAYIHRKAHIWRQIDWSLYDKLLKDEKK